jgi:hypothetical protein
MDDFLKIADDILQDFLDGPMNLRRHAEVILEAIA